MAFAYCGNSSDQTNLLGQYYGYSVSCVECRHSMDNRPTSKIPLKVKKCVYCGKDFEPVKLMRKGKSGGSWGFNGGDHDFNEDGRGIGFDFSGYNGTVKGIFPPREFYKITCKNCNKEFEYEYAIKYKLVNGQKRADMDGCDGSGVPCKHCRWWN